MKSRVFSKTEVKRWQRVYIAVSQSSHIKPPGLQPSRNSAVRIKDEWDACIKRSKSRKVEFAH